MKATAEQQLSILSRDVLPVLTAVVDGFSYGLGHSYLDDEQPDGEQPIAVRLTLGDYRRAVRLKAELERMP